MLPYGAIAALGVEHILRYYSEVSNYLPSLALFNMNIATTFNDTDGCYDDGLSDECNCRIAISYDTLSEENKCVADAIVESGNGYFSESFLTLYIDGFHSV